ncbi:Hsp70 family protein [Haloarcula nitratireducens]|uniref:Hsp70 family protein n=1 Tax=Haloarcula nitratireducens TaxID=2487749 RepID=A0AAW4PGW6_9EURY|nr:Hsp70 family protein [Halomicroarcula nitratireducens]MBX0296680.1 Hsp70 family protein [Halomicroarcula nitratireducens]
MADNWTLGIDLGTTRSAMAHVVDEEPKIIENSEGESVTPSVVHLTEDGESVVGEAAVDNMMMKPDRTVREIKKLIGTNETVFLGDEEYNPQEVSALTLQKLVNDAENRLGGSVTNAVITVPAYFTDRQRNATREAGELVGLDVDRLLPEPSAAVLAYGHREQQLGEVENENIFVYDLGGGTFDATLVEAEYEHNYIETIATDGDDVLGGSDWTEALVQYAYDVIYEDTGVDISQNDEYIEQRGRIFTAAQEAKHGLSEQQSVNLTVPFVVADQGYNLDKEITRADFEEMTADLLADTELPMDDIFARTEYTVEDVDRVLLIGGSTRMPQVEELVEDYFGIEPSKKISPDHAVALGASIQAAFLDDDVTGASISGNEDDGPSGVVLIDVLPRTIGIKVQPGDKFDPIVERDSQLPITERSEGYSVQHANQTSVAIEVFQGEDEYAPNNEKLGDALLEDIPPREPGQGQLAVEFTVNSDGTLELYGEDMMSGKEVTAEIDSALDSNSRDKAQLPPDA